MTSSLRIIVTGLIAQHDMLPGVAWDYIQYVVGLQRMGHDVYYIEDSGEWPYTLDGGPNGDQWVATSCERNVRHLQAVFSKYGLEDCWAYYFPYNKQWYGMRDKKRSEVVETADLLINVSGSLHHPERYARRARMAYIDSDPGFTQLKLLRGDVKFARRVAAHDVHFSFGECLPDVLTEKLAYQWLPTRTPIVLAEWHCPEQGTGPYTTVMNWTSYPPIVYDDLVFSQKDTEFISFLPLPSVVHPIHLQVAMMRLQHANWQTHMRKIVEQSPFAFAGREGPRALLKANGWDLVDSQVVCGDMESYRTYIQQSRGEWSVAKGGYVTAQSGWFSCRSACYLAAGRPVVVQDTGFGQVLPTGRGVIAFRTIEEAKHALEEVEGNYEAHSRAARELAATYFEDYTVLQALIENAFHKNWRKKIVY